MFESLAVVFAVKDGLDLYVLLGSCKTPGNYSVPKKINEQFDCPSYCSTEHP